MRKRGMIRIKGKKSQSGIIVTVLLIMMILVAIVVVWNVVHFTVSKSASQVSPDTFTTKITVPSTKLYSTGGAQVQVSRGTGKGTITELKFIFQNKKGDTNTLIINTNLPNELDTKIYNFNLSQVLFNNSDIAKISVVPVFGTNIGINTEETSVYSKDSSGNRVLDINPSSGLVSWWKFDGDMQDSFGTNHGSCINCPTLTTDNHGNTNNAYRFNGTNTYFNVLDSNSLKPSNITIAAWVYANSLNCRGINLECMIVSKYGGNYYGYYLRIQNSTGRADFLYDDGSSSTPVVVIQSTSAVPINQWIFLTGIFKQGTGSSIYINGVLNNSVASSLNLSNWNINLQIGKANWHDTSYFNGSIDNVMIFNKSLSADEVRALYNNQK